MGLADRITVLNYGQVLAEGTRTEIQSNPKVWRSISRHECLRKQPAADRGGGSAHVLWQEPHLARRDTAGRPGEVVGLLGRNGVGKSTALKTIMGLVRATEGSVRLAGQPITGLASHRLARLGMGMCPRTAASSVCSR